MNKKIFVFLIVATIICALLLAAGCDNTAGQTPGGEQIPSGSHTLPSGEQGGNVVTNPGGATGADEIFVSNGIVFTLNSDGDYYTVNGLDENNVDTQIDIPSSYQGKPVTAINSSAFENCRELTSVVIPSSVKYIGAYAFANCVKLKSAVIPSGVLILRDCVFQNCSSLESVEIPSSVMQIGVKAFYGCGSLKDVEIPLGVTDIGSGAFGYCGSLTEITIPVGVTKIGSLAFFQCTQLTVYCELSAAPSGWDTTWQGACPVVWEHSSNS